MVELDWWYGYCQGGWHNKTVQGRDVWWVQSGWVYPRFRRPKLTNYELYFILMECSTSLYPVHRLNYAATNCVGWRGLDYQSDQLHIIFRVSEAKNGVIFSTGFLISWMCLHALRVASLYPSSLPPLPAKHMAFNTKQEQKEALSGTAMSVGSDQVYLPCQMVSMKLCGQRPHLSGTCPTLATYTSILPVIEGHKDWQRTRSERESQ